MRNAMQCRLPQLPPWMTGRVLAQCGVLTGSVGAAVMHMGRGGYREALTRRSRHRASKRIHRNRHSSRKRFHHGHRPSDSPTCSEQRAHVVCRFAVAVVVVIAGKILTYLILAAGRKSGFGNAAQLSQERSLLFRGGVDRCVQFDTKKRTIKEQRRKKRKGEAPGV